ncbi:MAG: GspH/FimT family pseudopilin [Planctomycetes bacterium]|nr:GspH/FimT family pseudopilin [Planctomycetota bacterium]
MCPIRRESVFDTRSLRARAANRCRRGVTIVELVIVVMVMSIMAAVAAPAFFETLLYHRVESAARRVKADLDLARSTARLKSAAQSLTFSGPRYTLSAAVDGLDDANVIYEVDLADAPYEIGSVTADFSGTQTISFDGYGTPSSGGTVVLTCQGHRCTATLNGITGDVTITSSHARGGAP